MVKVSVYNAGDPGSIPGSGRSPGEGNGNPLQYSFLENSLDGGAWWATVHGASESDTTEQLHYFTFTESSHEVKRHLLLGRKALTNLDSILKSKDITLLTKICTLKAMVFLVIYGCET